MTDKCDGDIRTFEKNKTFGPHFRPDTSNTHLLIGVSSSSSSLQWTRQGGTKYGYGQIYYIHIIILYDTTDEQTVSERVPDAAEFRFWHRDGGGGGGGVTTASRPLKRHDSGEYLLSARTLYTRCHFLVRRHVFISKERGLKRSV